jgi:hypothetical protein
MKVYIDYLNFWGPYQILGLLNKVGVSKDTTDQWAADSPEWFTALCQWIYDKRKRKSIVKIHDYDTWSMDSTLSIIILPLLKQLKDTKHGTPMSMPAFNFTSDTAQDCFDFYKKDDPSHDAAIAQWDAVFDEMIWTFEQLQPDNDWEAQYCAQAAELDLAEYPEDEGKTCIPVRWKTEGKYDWEGMRAHQERISAGLKLFGVHFQSLWD